jgi:phospholipid-binding lipoprotein MlaA
VADKYRRLPQPVRAGVHNFFSNLREVVSFINYTAQLRRRRGCAASVASSSTVPSGSAACSTSPPACIPGARTGLGQTLARWGMHPGRIS